MCALFIFRPVIFTRTQRGAVCVTPHLSTSRLPTRLVEDAFNNRIFTTTHFDENQIIIVKKNLHKTDLSGQKTVRKEFGD